MITAAILTLLVAGLVLLLRRRKPPIHKGMGPRLALVPVHEVVRLNVPGRPRRDRRHGSGPHGMPVGGDR